VLAQLSMRVKAALSAGAADGADPFAKVKGLIQDMIEKLVADAAAEASHKAFCDKEMAESQAKIADHTAHIEKYTARKDKAVAAIERLTGEIAQLQADLAQIAKSQAEMNKMRDDEKKAFAVAKKEYEDGIEGLSGALQVLRDYYSAGESFVQADADQPSVGSHSKASGEATGIIGLLEVAESDFTKLLSEATVAEDSAQREYDKVSQENEVSTAMKKTSAAGKTTEVKETKARVGELESDISAEQTELDAVNEYYDKLKPACIAKPEPYAERKRRREAEISGLKEAMAILEGLGDDSFLAVRTVRRHLQ
jgi:chromosome segregation ATPase